MSGRFTPKQRKALLLATGAALFIMLCAIVAQVPPPSDANSLGAPDRNIENNNCFCHINSETNKEKDPNVAIFAPMLPDELASGTKVTFNVTLNYSKATKDTRYGFAIDLDSDSGKSLSGSSLSSPVGTASENKTHLTHNEPLEEQSFAVTLTAPNKPQRLKVNIAGNAVDNDATEKGDHWNAYTWYVDILKSRIVYVNVSVRNRGDMDASNVNLSMLVDGQFMMQRSVATVKAGGEENVTFNWDATQYKAGEYKIEVLLDANQTSLELNEGNNRLVKTVRLEDISGTEPKNQFDWQATVYLILGLLVLGLIAAVVYRRYG